jgi:hypothetical protein
MQIELTEIKSEMHRAAGLPRAPECVIARTRPGLRTQQKEWSFARIYTGKTECVWSPSQLNDVAEIRRIGVIGFSGILVFSPGEAGQKKTGECRVNNSGSIPGSLPQK